MKVQIRKANSGDLARLAVLWEEFMDFHENLDPKSARVENATELWFRYIEPHFDDDKWLFLVAEKGAELVGFVTATVREHPPVFKSTRNGFVESIAVSGAHRRQGIGRQLVKEATRWLNSLGISEISVRIDEQNPASKALFADAGFEPWVVVRRKTGPVD
jgi:GNAT superfamily N-acetyltransferase